MLRKLLECVHESLGCRYHALLMLTEEERQRVRAIGLEEEIRIPIGQ